MRAAIGAMNAASPTEARLRALDFAHPAVLLSCEKSLAKLAVVNDISMARAFRQSWTFSPYSRHPVPKMALCHVRGVLRKIYKDLVWVRKEIDEASWADAAGAYRLRDTIRMSQLAERSKLGVFCDPVLLRQLQNTLAKGEMKSPDSGLPGEWNFYGNEAPEFDYLLGVDLSEELTQRGMANPVRYVNCKPRN